MQKKKDHQKDMFGHYPFTSEVARVLNCVEKFVQNMNKIEKLDLNPFKISFEIAFNKVREDGMEAAFKINSFGTMLLQDYDFNSEKDLKKFYKEAKKRKILDYIEEFNTKADIIINTREKIIEAAEKFTIELMLDEDAKNFQDIKTKEVFMGMTDEDIIYCPYCDYPIEYKKEEEMICKNCDGIFKTIKKEEIKRENLF